MSAPSRTKTTTESIVIDGTAYEGGGGLIRYALAFACILNRPVHIHSIRAGRPGVGGLRSEHTVAVSTMAQLTSAAVIGNQTASRELIFTPYASLDADADGNGDALSPQPVLQQQKLDIKLEGSAGIFLVAMLPYLLFSRLASKTHHTPPTATPDEFELTIRAGTLCVKAPSIFYLQQVFLPTMALIGIGSNHLNILPDHYEQGWHTDTNKLPGKMTARIKPLLTPLLAFVLDRRGRVQTVRATAHAPPQLLDKFKQTLEAELADAISRDAGVDIAVDMFPSLVDHQYHLLLVAEATAPAAFLGYEEVYPQRDVFPSDLEGDTDRIIRHLVRACIRGLWEELRRGHAVDENLEDMLALYQSLAVGFSSVITPQGNGCLVPEFNIETPAIRRLPVPFFYMHTYVFCLVYCVTVYMNTKVGRRLLLTRCCGANVQGTSTTR
ncbi:RNA 3'-terminal phosphate cyclase/enolpyruvate transferase [Chaetomium sp. MPI-SDFR-AT-0129]|nr:RNA 3'-terminal phosphate cyclase/enolpyruvate transferase [Chaetomium sp. MPI-SDFR-AT-0129]